jgi:hypothetical protein
MNASRVSDPLTDIADVHVLVPVPADKHAALISALAPVPDDAKEAL